MFYWIPRCKINKNEDFYKKKKEKKKKEKGAADEIFLKGGKWNRIYLRYLSNKQKKV